nr:NAD(P)-dependent oxidoreductase [uncultured Carboxylicivirga sp.]
MEILVTGATGFIGNHLCRLLCEQGHKVIALVRPGSDTYELSNLPNINFVFGDILNHLGLNKLQTFPKIVFHLAADWSRLNVQDDQEFIDFLIKKKINKLIFYSSICASGLDLSTQPLDENNKPEFLPSDYYGKYKYGVESYINSKSTEGEFTGINLRPTIVYGPGDTSNLYPLFQAVRNGNIALWNKGKQLLRPCYISNLNNIAISLMEDSSNSNNLTLHVGDNELLSLHQVVKYISTHLGVHSKYKNHSLFLGKNKGFFRFVLNRFKLTNSFGTQFAFNKWTREYNANINNLKKHVDTNKLISFDRAIEETSNWYNCNNLI